MISKKLIPLVALCIAFVAAMNAQNLSTPDKANSIGNPALTNGVLNYNIDLFEISTKGASVPISITYTASGIMTDQLASSVGLGWNLQAGGSIVRELRGEPDDIREYGKVGWIYNYNDTGDDPSSANMIADFDPTELNEQEQAEFFAEVYGEESSHYHDLEPDMFTFNINGRSGQFVFAPGENNDPYNKEILIIPYQNLKITYEINDATEGIDEFTIIDENGVTYLFELKETTHTKIKTVVNQKEGLYAHQFDGSISSQSYTSAWFLTKIITPFYKTVTFNYQSTTIDLDEYIYKEYREYDEDNNPEPITEIITNMDGYSFVSTYMLEEIHTENLKLDFLAYQDRLDVSEADCKMLNEIVLKSMIPGHEKEIKRVIFEYDYFTNSNCGGDDEHLCKRLKLTGLSFCTQDDHYPPYRFEYTSDDWDTQIPKRTSMEKDIWGFYKSGVNSSVPITYVYREALPTYKKFKLYPNSNFGYEMSLNGSDRLPDESSEDVKIATLNKVIFPSGGYKRFEFEHNRFLLDNEEETGAGIRISKIYVCEDGISANEKLISEYKYSDPGNQYITSGRLLRKPQYGYFDNYEFDTNPSNGDIEYFNRNYIKTNFDLTNSNEVSPIIYEYIGIVKPGFGVHQ